MLRYYISVLLMALVPQLAGAANGEADSMPEQGQSTSWGRSLDTSIVWASRYTESVIDEAQPDSAGVNEEWLAESSILLRHALPEWVLSWRLDYDRSSAGSETTEELTELSWSRLLDDRVMLQLGKLNYDTDPGVAFHPTGHFQTRASPFNEFASDEGLQMMAASYWLADWVVSLLWADNGHEPAHRQDRQWATLLQRDVAAWSTALYMQQYEGSNIGLGGNFTYVYGQSWEFHGAVFSRRRTAYLRDLNEALANVPVRPVQFSDRNQQLLRGVVGLQWTGRYNRMSVEYIHDQRKLNESEGRQLLGVQNMFEYNVSQPASNIDLSNMPSILTELREQGIQQEYLFLMYEFNTGKHGLSATGLVGRDASTLLKLNYDYFVNGDIQLWLGLETVRGDANTEFGELAWKRQWLGGIKWAF